MATYLPNVRAGKILPPYVYDNAGNDPNKPNLDAKWPDPNGEEITLREAWQRVSISHYKNQGRRGQSLVKYDITDQMIFWYSDQFRELDEEMDRRVRNFKTWQQFAVQDGQNFPNPPPANASYFQREWLVTPIRRGPVVGSCGCGCGCG